MRAKVFIFLGATVAVLQTVTAVMVAPATGRSGTGALDTRYAGDAAANEAELVDTRFWAEAWGSEGVLDTKTPIGMIVIFR